MNPAVSTCSCSLAGIRTGSGGRAAVLLEPAQPHLADRRVRRHRVPEPVDRHLADDRDRRRVQQLARRRARRRWRRSARRGPRRRSPAPCPRSGRRTCSRRRPTTGRSRARGCRARPSRAAASVRPTEATSGSVKVTCGTCVVVGGGDVRAPRRVVDGVALRAGGDHVAGGARLVLALVGQQRPVVDVADRVEPVGARAPAGCRRRRATPRAGSRCVSSPRSAVRGVRPMATSTCSATTSAAVGEGRARRCCSVAVRRGRPRRPVRTVDAELRERRLDQLAARTAPCSSSRPERTMQRDLRAEARVGGRHLGADDAAAEDRRATRGRPSRSVASRLVHGSISRRPGMSGSSDADPVDTATACRATRSVTVPSSAVTAHALDAGELGVPAHQVDAGLRASHSHLRASSQSWVIASRRRSTPATSTSPVTACFAPSTPRAARSAAALRSSALDGMHAQYEHSPPTSSASTMTVVIPPCTVRSATFSPTAPAPITMTSYSRSLIPSRYPLRAGAGSSGRSRRARAAREYTGSCLSGKGLVVRPTERRTGTRTGSGSDPWVTPRGVAMEHVRRPLTSTPHADEDHPARRSTARGSRRRRPAVRAALACWSRVAVSVGGARRSGIRDARHSRRGGRHRQRPSCRAAHEPRAPRLPARRGDAAGGGAPGTRPTGSPRSRRSSCRGPTPTRAPAAPSSASAAAAFDAGDGLLGTGRVQRRRHRPCGRGLPAALDADGRRVEPRHAHTSCSARSPTCRRPTARTRATSCCGCSPTARSTPRPSRWSCPTRRIPDRATGSPARSGRWARGTRPSRTTTRSSRRFLEERLALSVDALESAGAGATTASGRSRTACAFRRG